MIVRMFIFWTVSTLPIPKALNVAATALAVTATVVAMRRARAKWSGYQVPNLCVQLLCEGYVSEMSES